MKIKTKYFVLKSNSFFFKKIIFIILFIFFFCQKNQILRGSFLNQNFQLNKILNSTKIKNDLNLNDSHNNITDENSLIEELNKFSNRTQQTNIIFADWYEGFTCCDKNAYKLFEYYMDNNIDKPYYIINIESDFYNYLVKMNKTSNLILYNEKNKIQFYKNLYEYLKNAKIIITAYSTILLQLVASYVPYIKYLKINHGVKHFKMKFAKEECLKSLINKFNVICSSPYEFQLLTKDLNYSVDIIHNASLARYDRFKLVKKNESENKCILASFTWRTYHKEVFQNSLYKKNLEKFLNDKELASFLKKKNIDLIYIPHHVEVFQEKNYSQNIYKFAKIKKQLELEHYIEHCSLLITDFSSLCFDFMFQNKPVLFYKIDKNEFIKNNHNDTLYFGNFFLQKKYLIDKIKFYVNNSFIISKDLKQKYESVFLYKTHIIEKIVEIIDKILKGK